MKILVLNAGSSSLKYQLIDMKDEKLLCKGLVDRIGLDVSNIIYNNCSETHKIEEKINNHTEALQVVFSKITDPNFGVIKTIKEVDAVGHRVLHSGESFDKSILITDETYKIMESNIELGPLHMPANLACIKSCQEILDVPMVAVFDTAFHMTMPKYAYMYGINYDDYQKYHIRRYGFHGTSHKFVSQEAIKYLGDNRNLKIITCHLGNGSSISAIKNGKCIDTSMGITPLEGLVMGTRSGNIDPAVIEYLMHKKGITIEETLTYLNKKCGFLGVSGISSDTRDLYAHAESGHERSQLVLDMFCYMAKKYIGSYAAALGGVDAIVFTGGIGENCSATRKSILTDLEFLGVKLDEKENEFLERGKLGEISKNSSKVKVLVIPTNEELVIARDTKDIILKIQAPLYKEN